MRPSILYPCRIGARRAVNPRIITEQRGKVEARERGKFIRDTSTQRQILSSSLKLNPPSAKIHREGYRLLRHLPKTAASVSRSIGLIPIVTESPFRIATFFPSKLRYCLNWLGARIETPRAVFQIACASYPPGRDKPHTHVVPSLCTAQLLFIVAPTSHL